MASCEGKIKDRLYLIESQNLMKFARAFSALKYYRSPREIFKNLENHKNPVPFEEKFFR